MSLTVVYIYSLFVTPALHNCGLPTLQLVESELQGGDSHCTLDGDVRVFSCNYLVQT